MFPIRHYLSAHKQYSKIAEYDHIYMNFKPLILCESIIMHVSAKLNISSENQFSVQLLNLGIVNAAVTDFPLLNNKLS